MQSDRANLRSDARANRDRILEVAREAFAAAPDASLNAIAKKAAVGAGTLYRHFPSREALVLAVYHKEIQSLVELAGTLVAKEAPLDAFRLWCERLADYGRIKHGLADVIHAAVTDEDHQQSYWPMVAATGLLLRACEDSGDFRKGVDPEDLLLLLGFLWRIKPGTSGKDRAERLLSVLIDGLRSRS